MIGCLNYRLILYQVLKFVRLVWSFILPANYDEGNVYIGFSLSVYSLSVDMILSTHVLGNGCMNFAENLNSHLLSSEDVHLLYSFWLDHFFFISKAFSCFMDIVFFQNKNIVLYLMKNFNLKSPKSDFLGGKHSTYYNYLCNNFLLKV